MMNLHLQSLLPFLFLTAVGATGMPGDVYDWKSLPEWWFNMGTQYGTYEFRKCAFQMTVPNTGDHCPGVVKNSDHYYCVFGDDSQPTWYCTCFQHGGDYTFHCNDSRLRTPQEIEGLAVTSDGQSSGGSSVGSNQGASVLSTPPKPGDDIDWSITQPQWWQDLKTSFHEELKKCAFMGTVPDTGVRCPGVAPEKDHYYCIYGTQEEATWYCTCHEAPGDYIFHCDTKLLTVEDIQAAAAAASGGSSNPPLDDSSASPNEATDSPSDQVTSAVPDPNPGDPIDWSIPEPQWWYNLKEDFDSSELRKCFFLGTIPQSGEGCPGVAPQKDHYYCIFGNSYDPTWYCTCYQGSNDYKFHCDTELVTVDEIKQSLGVEQPQQSDAKNGHFLAGFLTSLAMVLVLAAAVMGYRRYRNYSAVKRGKSVVEYVDNGMNRIT